MSSHTQIVVTPTFVKPTFTCSNCGGRFSDRHFCPSMPCACRTCQDALRKPYRP